MGAVALIAVAVGAFFVLPSGLQAVIDTMPPDSPEVPGTTAESEPEPRSPELEEVIEEGVEDIEKMEAWLEDYDDYMGRLGLTLDEIDFDGISDGRCRQLRRNLTEVSGKLGKSPDAEIDLLISRAIASFNEALKACRDEDAPAWALALLAGKELTHEAQQLMDRRYLYRGVLELELESATGEERSPESISGRFLSESLP